MTSQVLFQVTARGLTTAAVSFAVGAFTVMGVASASSPGGHVYSGCLSKAGKTVYDVAVDAKKAPVCATHDTALRWNQTGPAGRTGEIGKTGKTGTQGLPGLQGPQGVPGLQGIQGVQGLPGPGADLLGSNTQTAAPGSGATCTLGQVLLTAGAVAVGIPADGRLLAISTNSPLFSLLGTEYGGNGTTTFQLPNLDAAAPNGLTYSICNLGVFPSRN